MCSVNVELVCSVNVELMCSINVHVVQSLIFCVEYCRTVFVLFLMYIVVYCLSSFMALITPLRYHQTFLSIVIGTVL
jgi:hypothetical protein